MKPTTEWLEGFQAEMDNLLGVVALSDDFWASVEPKMAVEYAWDQFARAIIRFPVLRRDLFLLARDVSWWDGIKRRWMPMWVQRRWPPFVEVYDIDEISALEGEPTRYFLRVERMTQEQWLTKLTQMMEDGKCVNV